MKLYTNCHNCKKEIRFSIWTSDRVELSNSKGDKINLTCKHCGQKGLYHVNEIKATESKIGQIIALVIFIVGTPLTLLFVGDYIFQFNSVYGAAALGGLIGVPLIVYSIIDKDQRKRVRQFNNYKIKE